MKINIIIGSYNIWLSRHSIPVRHSCFSFSNHNEEKTWENNTLRQFFCAPLLFDYCLSVTRTRLFKDVPNIKRFENRYNKRIGVWR